MARNKKLTKALTCILLLTLVISSVFTVFMSATVASDTGNSSTVNRFDGKLDTGYEQFLNGSVMYKLPGTISSNDEISLIIEMPINTLLDAYDAAKTDLSFSEYSETDEAKEIKAKIDSAAFALQKKLVKAGVKYTLGESYDTVLSGFEINVIASEFETVCQALERDANVIIGDEYEESKTELVENNVNVYEETGIFDSSSFGYDGTGMVIAVLDTGLDYYHSAFSTNNFHADRNKLGMTYSDVAALLSGTTASKLQTGLTASDVYISEKVPYGFDYADKDSDVFPIQSDHGTHVAGVIAGNDDVITGVAPNAQLVIMKIFSDIETTARTSWILSAVEDCVALDVDVINMSIGTSAGFSRTTDKEAISGVYDRIRERGISLVVAASNSFNSTYGSDKNGNLGLTSNPDSGTVGSPSTYPGAMSVASINGSKTPYLLYKDKGEDVIMYFIESTDRVSEEKHFVEELLGEGRKKLEIEYVTIPGVGRTADYTGMDVKGKIALVCRGDTTFEEKANAAEAMGAAGIIVYNNVSGEIKMNVGDTKLAACSISQDDGELLAAAGRGTITISLEQTSGPFMSDFSSWGPTPDLKIKPEITAHGGSILSSVPGQAYDRISGTSMACPNIAGVTALIRQYITEAFTDIADDALEVNATVNRLMMSTADVMLGKNGLPYSVRKQGAGLANLTNIKATNAYILTYELIENESGKKVYDTTSPMDKSKIELGDDPDKTGVYELVFSVKNFGASAISYDVSAFVLTEGVSETKTHKGETTVTEEAYSLDGAKLTLVSVEGGEKSGKTVTVGAGDTATVTAKITLSAADKKYLDDSFENGMYVEGFITLDANGNEVDLSVPYLAFYGDWTVAPLFDKDYFETSKDELDNSIPLLDKTLPDAYATRPIGGTEGDYVSYLGSYYFIQDPKSSKISADRKYISISNQADAVNSLRYIWAGMLRGAERVEIVITEDATGEVVFTKTENNIRKSYGDGGPIRPANIDVEFSAIDNNLKNNTAYTVTLKGYLDYADGGENTNLNNEFSFPFITDFEAPAITGCEFYTEYDRSAKKTRLFAKMAVYDNHYSMALQIGYVTRTANEFQMNTFDRYLTQVYSDFNSTNYVVYELTDYIDEISLGAAHKNTFTVACYDYALNIATYEIDLPDSFTDFRFEGEEFTYDESLGMNTLSLSPYEVYDLDPTVYPATEWNTLITYSSSNTDVATVVGNQIIPIKSGTTIITGRYTVDGKTIRDSFQLTVLSPDDDGYKRYSKPVAENFILTGYYTDRAFYQLAAEDRDIGETGSEMKFSGAYALSMYPSEAVTLRYTLNAYFPEDTKVVFESGNEKIVTVDEKGKITAVSEGLSSITVKVLMDGKSTYYSKSISIEVKDPFVTSGPSLSNYYGSGVSGVVTFPKSLAVTDIGQFAFSNYDYVMKDEFDEISDEVPETMKIWFIGDDTIKEVVIPEGVERIGAYAFANLTALEKITLPSTLHTIDYGAFYGCKALKEVKGLENVKFINQRAFESCGLTGTLSFGATVAIADYAFANNAAMTGVVLAESTQSVGAYAFANNTAMRTLDIKADIIKIGKYAFTECSALESVSINAAVIPTGTFNECKSLSSVTLGKDVSVIGEYAFRNTKVESFKVAVGNATFAPGESSYLISEDGTELLLVAPAFKGVFTLQNGAVVSIANAAFSGNTHITSVVIPSVTSVGDFAFSECSSLTSVTLGILTHIGNYAFESTSIGTLPSFSESTVIGNYAFAKTKLTEITLPDGVVIGKGAFKNCASLASVEIGENAEIRSEAFAMDEDNWRVDFYEINNGKENVYYYVYLSKLTSLVIGDNANIGDSAFLGASALESATLGKGAIIGRKAFFNASALTDIDLSDVKSIGDMAFSGYIHYEYADESCQTPSYDENGDYKYRYYSPALTSIDLSSLTYIGKEAFAYCKSLESVVLGDKLTKISESAFGACNKLASVNLDKVTEVGVSAFAECAISSLELPLATVIDEYAFCKNETLTSLTLAEGVRIYEGAFSECTALSQLTGEEKAKYIGDYAFTYTIIGEADLSIAEYVGDFAFMKREYAPMSVKLSKALTDIGENPFALCKVLPFSSVTSESFGGKDYETVTYTFDYSETVKVIDGSLYRAVPDGLELILWTGELKAMVPEGTVRIGAMAFAYDDLTSVVLPTTLRAIGHKAFYGCDALSLVTFKSHKAPILEEEYDELYFATGENLSATGDYEFAGINGDTYIIPGLEIIPYFMWNSTSMPTNVYYGASFVDYIGHVDNKITMVRPVNGLYYDSFVLGQYFDLFIEGGAACEQTTLDAIAAIESLPDTKDIKLSHKALVEAARAAYDKVLSYEQRALVTNLSKLTAAEKKIADYEATVGGDTDNDKPDDNIGGDVNTEPDHENLIGKYVLLALAGALLLTLVLLVLFIRLYRKEKRPPYEVSVKINNKFGGKNAE